jgi:5-methylcytosine-specific restriction endonuclease McrA
MLAKRATVDDACHPSNYSRKLKDPRWQKRRLQVLEAAKWACATCGATDKTLHVHHKFYTPCTEPWDYPDEALCALCEDCHQHAEHEKETQQHGR